MHIEKNIIAGFAGVVILLGIGEIYLLTRPQNAAPTDVPVTQTEQATDVPIPSNLLRPVLGVVQSADASSITLMQGSTSVTIALGPDTSIVLQGALKDSDQQEADMEAFHMRSTQLALDPVKNKAALETLIAPSQYTETPISANALQTGERVVAFTLVEQGQPHAVRILVLPVFQEK